MRPNPFKLMFPKKRKHEKTDAEFEKRFRRLYGDAWVVVRCGGIREKQVQRDVIKAVSELAKEHGIRGEYEIEISRPVQEPGREDVTVRYQTLGCYRNDN